MRRWHPETLDCAVHTGHRRVSSGLAGPHPDLRTREVARPRNPTRADAHTVQTIKPKLHFKIVKDMVKLERRRTTFGT